MSTTTHGNTYKTLKENEHKQIRNINTTEQQTTTREKQKVNN